MANFKICVRKKRKDGFYPVYIRVSIGSQIGYIKTEKITTDLFLSKSGEVTDPYVQEPLSRRILEYASILNHFDTGHWSIKQVINTITKIHDDVSFSTYADKHIARLYNNGQERNSRNYKLAVGSLNKFFNSDDVKFSQLTSQNLNAWIKSLEQTNRAKEMYPVCVRQIFKAAVLELNDEDNDFVLIKGNPWARVKIPKSDTPEKRAIPAEECRRFFSAALPESKMKMPQEELGRDIAKMVLCLAGMNTIDIYELRKEDYHHGVLHYRRSKTKRLRADSAYFEIKVPSLLQSIFKKYMAAKDDEYLFNFHRYFSSSDSFNANVNSGIKKVCSVLGIPRDKWYCVYTFRHTWATTAQNDCSATIAEVGFALNHSQTHGVTRGYIKPDFTPAWNLNEKVIDFIFFSDKPSKLSGRNLDDGISQDEHQGLFRISPKMMIRAAAFFQGRCLGHFEDIGYSNVDEVIDKLVQILPADIPQRSIVQFKIVNMDNEKVAMYERMKGKGF